MRGRDRSTSKDWWQTIAVCPIEYSIEKIFQSLACRPEYGTINVFRRNKGIDCQSFYLIEGVILN